jgi:hypothetical protein
VRWIRSVALAFVASGLALGALACDSSEDPKPASMFPELDPTSRDLVGHVHAGSELVAGAFVRVDPSAGFAASPFLVAASDTNPRFARTGATDTGGFFRFEFAPFVYDLSIAHGRDLYVFHEVVTRAFDPVFAVDPPVTGWKARVLATTNPPPAAGNATVFFVSGVDARTIAPVAGTSGALDAVFRHFDSTVTLHAIEYVRAGGPAAAVAEGKLDVRVRDGAIVSPVVAMTPITAMAAATFDVTAPAGHALAALELEMDLGLRTSAVPLPLTHAMPGAILNFAVATDARYFVRARATQAGAVSDSGRFRVNPFDKNVIVLPPPVSTEAPIDDQAIAMGEGTTTMAAPAQLARGGALSARFAKGIVEHALVPESGNGTTVHVVTPERTTSLPDASALGLAPPSGRYLWTVQSFPTLAFTDHLGGEDGRVVPPSWTSAPRVIVVQ